MADETKNDPLDAASNAAAPVPRNAAPLSPAESPAAAPPSESENAEGAEHEFGVIIPHAIPPAKTPESAVPVPTPTPTPVPSAEPAQNNIAHILDEVKLPERREFRASADVKAPAPHDATILEERVTKVAGHEGAAKPPAPKTPHAPEEPGSSVVPVRTLKDDLQSIVREQKISLVRAVSLEEDKKRGREEFTPEQDEIRKRRTRRVVGILFAAFMLFFLGGAAIFGVYVVMQERQTSPVGIPQSSILFAESTKTLDLDNQAPGDLKSELAQARTQSLGTLGSITRVEPTLTATSTSGTATLRPATIAEFFSALGIQPPQELMDAIGPDFFFGFHVVDKNSPLLVIPVTSYDHAFAGMLAWEPNMNADLSPIFTAVSPTVLDASGLPVPRTFADAVLRNYDIRTLSDDSGNVELYYSFPTPNILVIAENEYSFAEILSRLQSANRL